ncbi:MAG: RHS repeat protein, partial [Propionibacteriaceae bacterium]|nr:RHS repeat protein [Propionibacteriaceae bacterium]
LITRATDVDLEFGGIPVTRNETFSYNLLDILTGHTIVGVRSTSYESDDEGRFIRMTNPDGVVRNFSWNNSSQLTSETGVSYGYDGAGRLSTVTVAGGNTYTLNYDDSGRLTGATGYVMTYDAATGHLKKIADSTYTTLGGIMNSEFDPDKSGYATTRRLKSNTSLLFTVVEPADPMGALDYSSFTLADQSEQKTQFSLWPQPQPYARLPMSIKRPGDLNTFIMYTPQREVTYIKDSYR